MIAEQYISFTFSHCSCFSRVTVDLKDVKIARAPHDIFLCRFLTQIFSRLDAEIDFTTYMNIDRRSRLNNSWNSHAYDVKNMWAVLKVQEDVAVTRAQTMHRHRLIVLVKADMYDFWVAKVEAYADPADLLGKLVRSIDL